MLLTTRRISTRWVLKRRARNRGGISASLWLRYTWRFNLFNLRLFWTIMLYRECLTLENVYTLTCCISYYNAISNIINPDRLKNLTLSDVLNLLHINGISMFIRIDYLILSIDIVKELTDIRFITSHNSFIYQ